MPKNDPILGHVVAERHGSLNEPRVQLSATCRNGASIERYCDECAIVRLGYGPLFRAVRAKWTALDGVQSVLELCSTVTDWAQGLHFLHPALLDAVI